MITVVTMRPVATKPRKSITAIIAHVLLDPNVGMYGTEKVGNKKPWEKKTYYTVQIIEIHTITEQ